MKDRDYSKKSKLLGGTDHSTHHLLEIREPGEILVALRTELAYHDDIVAYASQGINFEDCIARIATKLDIAVDGLYDPTDLMEMLTIALRNRRNGVKNPHELARGLINAEIEEKENTVEIVERENHEITIH